MPTVAPTPPPASVAKRNAIPAQPPSLFKRIPQGQVRGVRLVLNAVEGWGKTTLGAYAPDPVILMARGETGFATLRQTGLVPDVDSMLCESWKDALAAVDALATTHHQTVVLDALGGFERLCHEKVCQEQFAGDWGEKGFASFQRGYDVSIPVWLGLLQKLDQVRARGANIVILGHAKISPFKNPDGPDYDRYTSDCHQKTWNATAKWSDAILFGQYVAVVDEKKKKAAGGTERIIYCERRAAWDAKNRYGMPPSIAMNVGPAAMWQTVWQHIDRNHNIETPEIPE